MPRPRKCRRISEEPDITYFKPAAVPLRELRTVEISVDELEALKLVDCDSLEQVRAARRMGISQPTLHRLLVSARKKTADALANGYAMKIRGGNYYISKK